MPWGSLTFYMPSVNRIHTIPDVENAEIGRNGSKSCYLFHLNVCAHVTRQDFLYVCGGTEALTPCEVRQSGCLSYDV